MYFLTHPDYYGLLASLAKKETTELRLYWPGCYPFGRNAFARCYDVVRFNGLYGNPSQGTRSYIKATKHPVTSFLASLGALQADHFYHLRGMLAYSRIIDDLRLFTDAPEALYREVYSSLEYHDKVMGWYWLRHRTDYSIASQMAFVSPNVAGVTLRLKPGYAKGNSPLGRLDMPVYRVWKVKNGFRAGFAGYEPDTGAVKRPISPTYDDPNKALDFALLNARF